MKMQQTKSYWRLVAVASVVSAFVASACVVTTSTDDNDTGGSGGSGAKAGSSTTGGSTTTGGGSTTGGSSANGGSGTAGSGESFVCDDPLSDGGAKGDASSCEPSDSTDECQVCIQQKCCAEYGACYATDPGNQCGYGGPAMVNGAPNEGGELLCMHECLKKRVADSMISATESDILTCANECPTEKCGGATVGFQTSDVIGCMNTNCSMACWGPK
jgi:hypothetical protein